MVSDLFPAQLIAIERKICTLCGPAGMEYDTPLPFATDDNHAFTLVDELVGEGWGCRLSSNRHCGLMWHCAFVSAFGKPWRQGTNPSRPVAICLAYLRAKGVNVEKLLAEAAHAE